VLVMPSLADGNEADSEGPSHHHKTRPPSALAAASGRQSSMLASRARGRVDDAGVGDQVERPGWRR